MVKLCLFFVLKVMDDQRAVPSEAFFIGQSVRSNILDVGELSKTDLSEVITFKSVYLLLLFNSFSGEQ